MIRDVIYAWISALLPEKVCYYVCLRVLQKLANDAPDTALSGFTFADYLERFDKEEVNES